MWSLSVFSVFFISCLISAIETSDNCLVMHLTATEASQLASSSQPLGLNPGRHFCWIIKGRTGYELEITFDTIEIDYSQDCFLNYVSIYDFDDDISNRKLKEKTCGSKQNLTFKMKENALVEFKSSSFSLSFGNRVHFQFKLVNYVASLHAITGVVIGGIVTGIFLFFIIGGVVCCVYFCKRTSTLRRNTNHLQHQVPFYIDTPGAVMAPVAISTTTESKFPPPDQQINNDPNNPTPMDYNQQTNPLQMPIAPPPYEECCK